MDQDLNEVKHKVSSLLTISKTEMTIKELQYEYCNFEGEQLPYRRLGFNSALQLLQNMPDILKLPSNPNEFSKITPNVSEKSSHLRQLVMKQRSHSKTKKDKSRLNGESNSNGRNMNNQRYNHYRNKPNSSNNFVNNNNVNNFQNRDNSVNSNTHSSNYDRRSLPTSLVSGRIDKESPNQNGVNNYVYVTDELRAYIEFNIYKKGQKISKRELEELIKNHKDFPALKSNNMNDIIDKISTFLIISEDEVLLKCKNQFELGEKDVPAIYSNSAFYNQSGKDEAFISRQSSEEADINHSQHDNSHFSSTTNNGFNNLNKTWNGFDQLDSNQLENTNESTNSKFNEEYYNDVINDFKLIRLKTRSIPDKVIFNMAKLFENLKGGVNIENFKFMYCIIYHSVLDSTVYGFSTDLQMFNCLNGNMIKISNDVLFTKKNFDFDKFYKNIQFNDNDQAKQNLFGHIKNSIPDIAINVDMKIPFISREVEHGVIMGEAYDPSIFFVRYGKHLKKYADLMKNMQIFYEQENSKFCVQPKKIIPGLSFVSCYTSNLNIKQWRRIRILKEVDQMSVEVFHVDYGLVQIIPKTEIRFLKYEFSELPCQAIHCCLDGYNVLNLIPHNVIEAFFEMTLNKKLGMRINVVKNLSNKSFKYRVFHVTLLNTDPMALYSNINDELTYKYLAEWKAAQRYLAYKCQKEAGVSDSNSELELIDDN